VANSERREGVFSWGGGIKINLFDNWGMVRGKKLTRTRCLLGGEITKTPAQGKPLGGFI